MASLFEQLIGVDVDWCGLFSGALEGDGEVAD